MSNGQRIIVLRVLASSLISLTAILAATWLMEKGILIPTAFWIIATLAVGGVAGADVVTAILHTKQGGSPDGTGT